MAPMPNAAASREQSSLLDDDATRRIALPECQPWIKQQPPAECRIAQAHREFGRYCLGSAVIFGTLIVDDKYGSITQQCCKNPCSQHAA